MKRFVVILWLRAIGLLPWSGVQALGRLVGELLVRIPNRQRRDALINIRLCFPDMSDAEQLALRHKAIIHFAKTYVELGALWTWSSERVIGLVKQRSGLELLQREPGEGLIVLGPHIGAWEAAGLFLATQGRLTSMYKPQKYVDDIILAARERNGGNMVPDDVTGVKQMLKALRNGELVGILPDQVTREETGGVFAPFFDVPASTMLLVAGLVRRTKVRAVIMFAERLPGGQGFHLHCLPVSSDLGSKDDFVAATAVNKAVEDCIAICPEQYHWTYRRFRRRPGGLPSPYTGPSI